MAKKKSGSNNLINAALYILVGILLCLFNKSVFGWLITGIGVLMIVSGVLKCIKGEVLYGVLSAVIGVVIITCGWFDAIALIVLGVAIAINAFMDLLVYLRHKNIIGILASGITVAVGVMLALQKTLLFEWLFLVLGIVLIVDGLLTLIGKGK